MGLQYRSCWETMSGGMSIYFGTLKDCVGALVGRLRFKLHIIKLATLIHLATTKVK